MGRPSRLSRGEVGRLSPLYCRLYEGRWGRSRENDAAADDIPVDVLGLPRLERAQESCVVASVEVAWNAIGR